MLVKFVSTATAAALCSVALTSSNQTFAQDQIPGTQPNLDTASLEAYVPNQVSEEAATASLQTLLRAATPVQVMAHGEADKQAATVYISDIPVLTYTDSASVSVTGWLPPGDEPVVVQTGSTAVSQKQGAIAQATAMAKKLEDLHQQAIDPTTVTARWNDGAYSVMVGDTPLVTLGEQVQLPDATSNKAEDVLQVTNRLRRLIGDTPAEPVSEVTGRPAPPAPVRRAAVRSSLRGMASWYGPGFHGRYSASGERFNQYALTAAHRTLPFGTRVRVTNVNNGRQVVVRINDRGPYSHGRVIDLSAGAARAIGLQAAGVGMVQLEVLD